MLKKFLLSVSLFFALAPSAFASDFYIPSTSYYGYIRGGGNDWASILPTDSANNVFTGADTFLARIRGTTGGSWDFWEQGKICFDTDGASIDSVDTAVLNIYVTNKINTITGQYINIYDEAGDDTVSTDDAWDGNRSEVLASVNIDSFGSSGWQQITLDESKIDVNRSGNTCILGIIKSQAESGSEPATYSDKQAFILMDDFANNEPYLSLTFQDTVCGDGVIDSPPETCDDGNTSNGDGCSSVCAVSSGWTCSGEPSTCVENITCWEDCYQSETPSSDIFAGTETCGVGAAVAFPLTSEPTCTLECWQCGEGYTSLSWLFRADEVCGEDNALDYPETSEPITCENHTCYSSDCDADPSSLDVAWNETCGVGAAVAFPLLTAPYCAGVPCWTDCDSGAIYQLFSYGSECGAGDAIDFTETNRPSCQAYYSMACNVKYFSLCETEEACLALGDDFVFDNDGCNFLPNGPAGFTTELEALNKIADQNDKLLSAQKADSNMSFFTLPAILFFLLIFVGIAVVGALYHNLFSR